MERIEVFLIESVTEVKDNNTLEVFGEPVFIIKTGEIVCITIKNEVHSFVVKSITFEGRQLKETSLFQKCTLVLECKEQFNTNDLNGYLFGKEVSDYSPNITFEQARQMAEELAFESLNSFVSNKSVEFLSNRFEEAECCWFFFSNDDITLNVPEEAWFTRSYNSYAISKRGEVRNIYNYTNEQEKLEKYLLIMSNYFKLKGL